MENKNAYKDLDIETILFETEDVITTSGVDIGGDPGGDSDTNEWE